MGMVQSGCRSLALIFEVNLDRLIYPVAILVGLVGGAMIGGMIFEMQVPPIPTLR